MRCDGPLRRTSWWPLCHRCFRKRAKAQTAAYVAVARAIRKGELPRPATKICVDCGAPAAFYDHRDYSRPLAVDAVCRSCNCKRGPGALPLTPAEKNLLREGVGQTAAPDSAEFHCDPLRLGVGALP